MRSDDRRDGHGHTDASVSAADIDDELLTLVREVLQRSGYVVAEVRSPEVPVLIAENADNIILVTATVTVQAAIRAEPVLSQLLVKEMGERGIGPKGWDGYVTLLTSQAAPAAITGPLFGITYNLRHVRRLVKVGVEPTLAAVARALRAVLPLPAPPPVDELSDPLTDLKERLIQQGVDRRSVESSFSRLQAVQLHYPIDDDVHGTLREEGSL